MQAFLALAFFFFFLGGSLCLGLISFIWFKRVQLIRVPKTVSLSTMSSHHLRIKILCNLLFELHGVILKEINIIDRFYCRTYII